MSWTSSNSFEIQNDVALFSYIASMYYICAVKELYSNNTLHCHALKSVAASNCFDKK
jgi:hypothetical protein